MKIDTIRSHYELDNYIQNFRNVDRSRLSERDRRIIKYYPAVVRMAYHYRYIGLSLEDLIGEGMLALTQASDSFRADFGINFWTYAKQAVSRRMRASAVDARPLHLPLNVLDEAWEIKKTQEAFFVEHQREPTALEIADLLSMDVRRIVCIMDALSHAESLDRQMYDDNDSVTLADRLAAESVADENAALTAERIKHRAKFLSARQQEIFQQYFIEDRDLDDIAKEFGLSRERLRQIIYDIRKKLAVK